MIKGSCCCGAVQFELSSKPKFMGSCHCSRCRKVGAGTIAFVEKETLNLISGKAFIATFKAVAPYKYDRNFCSQCGSALGEILSGENMFPIAANCFDTDPGLEISFHEFVSEKPGWFKICDDAPQYEKHPPQGE